MNLVFIQFMCCVAVFGDTRAEVPSAASQKDARDMAITSGMVLYCESDSARREYNLTDKGHAYVEALRAIKEPVATWSIPA